MSKVELVWFSDSSGAREQAESLLASDPNGFFKEVWTGMDMIMQVHGALAVSEGINIGFIIIPGENEHIELHKLYVHSSYRNKGYGRQIVDEFVSWAKSRGVESITLTPENGSEEFWRAYLNAIDDEVCVCGFSYLLYLREKS